MKIETLMFVLFIALFIVSIYKLYAFLPNEVLEDDDTTPEAEAKLEALLDAALQRLCHNAQELSEKSIYNTIITLKEFDKERFWRFNQNRSNQLLRKKMLKKGVQKIVDLCH